MTGLQEVLDFAQSEPNKTPPDSARLLATRAIVEAALDTVEQPLNCQSIFDACSEGTAAWASGENRPEATLIGLLNLFVEVCRRATATCPHCCVRNAAVHSNRLGVSAVLALLPCLLAAKEPNSQAEALTKLWNLPEGTERPKERWDWLRKTSIAWDTHLTSFVPSTEVEPQRRLGDTDLGQTLVMHLLEVLLPLHGRLSTPRLRAEVNVMLAPLLRVVFRSPDRAHVVYQRYHFGSSPDVDGLFHCVYKKLLASTEAFKSLGNDERTKLLAKLSAKATDRVDRSLMLTEVLHGTSNAKPTRICQLSLLVKQEAQSEFSSERTAYRADFTSEGFMQPGSAFGDQWGAVADDVFEQFRNALDTAYAGGHSEAQLRGMFDVASAERPFPVWFYDGEITLLQLQNGDHGVIRHLLSEANVSNKGWALVSFLERAAIMQRPTFYSVGDPGDLVARLYEAIEGLDLSTVKDTDAFQVELKKVATDDSCPRRLLTYAPETFLRQHHEPLALFFYPLSGAAVDMTAPAAFIGGTVGGCGGGCLPDVTALHDYVLYSALAAVRPVIDASLADALQERLNQVEAIQKASIAEQVSPIVEELSELFLRANNRVLQIESIVDVDWLGLFGKAVFAGFKQIFDDNAVFKTRDIPELKNLAVEVKGQHGEDTTATQLYRQLMYLVRRVLLGNGQSLEPMGDDKGLFEKWNRTATYTELLARCPWMLQFLFSIRHFPDDAKALKALVRLLTVRALQSDRRLHPAQAAAALGLGRVNASSHMKGTVFIDGSKDVVSCDLRQANYQTGVKQLLEIIRRCPDSDGAATVSGVTPAQLLRSLRTLVGNTLIGDRDGAVIMKSWYLGWKSTERRLLLVLRCDGRFDDGAKEALSEYHPVKDEDYHNLRSNFRTVWRAAGGFPLFAQQTVDEQFFDPDALWAYADEASSTMTIVESKKQKQTVVVVDFKDQGNEHIRPRF